MNANGSAINMRALGAGSASRGSTSNHPHSSANVSTAGAKGSQMRHHIRDSDCGARSARDPAGHHQPAAISAAPQSAGARMANTSSRSIGFPAMNGHRTLQLIDK